AASRCGERRLSALTAREAPCRPPPVGRLAGHAYRGETTASPDSLHRIVEVLCRLLRGLLPQGERDEVVRKLLSHLGPLRQRRTVGRVGNLLCDDLRAGTRSRLLRLPALDRRDQIRDGELRRDAAGTLEEAEEAPGRLRVARLLRHEPRP